MDLEHLALEQPGRDAPERTGTQSLGRGIKLMRVIAARPDFGWRLSDLAAACKQDKGTVHRMLACLVEERLVTQRATDRRYLPGPLMYELGLAIPARVQFQRRAESLLQSFARRMGGISLLLLRSGNEYVCSVRAGALPLAGLMVQAGTRRPLITSVGGIAIIQTLGADEARQVLLNNVSQEIAGHGTMRLQALQKMQERSDHHGWGVNLGDVVPGVHAFSVPVRDMRGDAFAAVCLMGTADLYGEKRLPELRDALQAVAGALSADAHKFSI
ncbi:IclR family transcriptional regulator [Bordetella sp. BOR01]|uniref:IclR family transcriptional regulator n=1 Tax=Bordetella sp. BOR01 TaxID=2854779 RepID=UPI001C4658A4|nr:helix-turn-helix domain-containing protein [Bordetella sp. BOR01]MBV7486037.1 helix-turn-helix domain-containing protein [Bordetella sp. BOR01]